MKPSRAYSIVIPLYNKGAHIGRTLTSILEQSYPHFEIIVVDDGSTDGSAEMVRRFKDKRIRLIQQQNQGVSVARNRGIKEACYDMIALIDADDSWDSNYLFQINKLVEKYPNISIFGARFAFIKEGELIPSKSIFASNQKEIVFDLLEVLYRFRAGAIPINSSNTVFRKRLVDQAGNYDPKIVHFEDLDFFLRMSQYSKVAFFNGSPLAFYDRDASMSVKSLPALDKHFLGNLGKFSNRRKEDALFSAFMDRFILDVSFRYVEKKQDWLRLRELLKTVNPRAYTLKDRCYYSSLSLGFLLIKLNRMRQKHFKTD